MTLILIWYLVFHNFNIYPHHSECCAVKSILCLSGHCLDSAFFNVLYKIRISFKVDRECAPLDIFACFLHFI